MAVLSLESVVVRSGTFVLEASLTAGPGVTVIFGPSGCGKTTLLRLVAGLQKPVAGRVRLENALWDEAASRHHTPVQQRRVGYVPQEGLVFPHLTVAENLAFGLKHWTREARQQRIQELLDLLGLPGLERRRALALSGGQRQRVALGRALAPRPSVLLLDEPLSALDRPEQRRLQRELQTLLPGLDIPCLWVTHNRHEAHLLGQHAVVMGEGRVLQQGPMGEVFERPQHPEVARLFGITNVVEGVVGNGWLTLGPYRWPWPEGSASGPIFACIRGEDILVSDHPVRTSGMMTLQGRVAWVVDEGALVRLRVEGGLALEARASRACLEEHSLQVGQELHLAIRMHRIHLMAR